MPVPLRFNVHLMLPSKDNIIDWKLSTGRACPERNPPGPARNRFKCYFRGSGSANSPSASVKCDGSDIYRAKLNLPIRVLLEGYRAAAKGVSVFLHGATRSLVSDSFGPGLASVVGGCAGKLVPEWCRNGSWECLAFCACSIIS